MIASKAELDRITDSLRLAAPNDVDKWQVVAEAIVAVAIAAANRDRLVIRLCKLVAELEHLALAAERAGHELDAQRTSLARDGHPPMWADLLRGGSDLSVTVFTTCHAEVAKIGHRLRELTVRQREIDAEIERVERELDNTFFGEALPRREDLLHVARRYGETVVRHANAVEAASCALDAAARNFGHDYERVKIPTKPNAVPRVDFTPDEADDVEDRIKRAMAKALSKEP